MDVSQLIEFVLHMDAHLSQWTQEYGAFIYVILFLTIFCETGLVVTPFLPGDSLLFAVGALTALDSSLGGGLDYTKVSLYLVIAAFLGDNTNYQLGRILGIKIFSNEKSRFLNPSQLVKTQRFYEKYGSRAIVIARFAPLLRTFVPFVAGVGRMNFLRYLGYSFLSAVLWTQVFLLAGNRLGNIPQVKNHFHMVILGVIAVSLIPVVVTWVQNKKSGSVT